MIQYIHAIMDVEHEHTCLGSIERECCSVQAKKPLLDIRTQFTTETSGVIILNCSGLESINSHGICLLIKLLIYAKRQQKRLQVFGLNKHNQFIFEITRLNKFIDIVETEEQNAVPNHNV